MLVKKQRAFAFFSFTHSALFLASFVSICISNLFVYFLMGGIVVTVIGILRYYDKISIDIYDLLFIGALFAYGIVWSLDALYSGVTFSSFNSYIPFWAFFAILFLVGWRTYSISISFICIAIFSTCLCLLLIALIEKLILGQYRVNNGFSPIIFGNIALCLAASALPLSYIHSNKCWIIFGLLSVGAGIFVSLLSGSRGGWIAIPILGWIIWQQLELKKWFDKKYFFLVLLFIGCAFLLINILPNTQIFSRLDQIINNIIRYREGDSGTSLGLRFEMWKGAWIIFKEHPLLGVGEAALVSSRDYLVDAGELNPKVRGLGRLIFDNFHSDLFDTAARRGVLGVISLIILYFLPLWLFWQRSYDKNLTCRLIAISGVLVIVSFIFFGLSYSMLRDPNSYLLYIILTSSLWSALRYYENSNNNVKDKF